MVKLSGLIVVAVVVAVLGVTLVLTLLFLAVRRVCARKNTLPRLTALRTRTCIGAGLIASALAIACALTALAYGSRNQISTMLANMKLTNTVHLRDFFFDFEKQTVQEVEMGLKDPHMIKALAELMAGAKYTRTINFGTFASMEYLEVSVYRDTMKTDEFCIIGDYMIRGQASNTQRYECSLPRATMIVKIRELVFPDRQTK